MISSSKINISFKLEGDGEKNVNMFRYHNVQNFEDNNKLIEQIATSSIQSKIF